MGRGKGRERERERQNESEIINLDKGKVIPSELTMGGLTCIACRHQRDLYKPEKINLSSLKAIFINR